MATYYVSTTGSDTTGDGSSGNPWASPGYASGQIASDDEIIINSGSYPISVDADNVSGGKVAPTVSCTVTGLDSPVLLIQSGVTGDIVRSTTSNARFLFRDLVVDANGVAGILGFSASNSNAIVERCTAIRCSIGFRGLMFRCAAILCDSGYGAGNGVGEYFWCAADECTVGFDRPNTMHVCFATACDYGFSNSSSNAHLVGSGLIAYDCGTGFRNTAARQSLIAGALAASCATGYDINSDAAEVLDGAFSWDSGGTDPAGITALTADPFVDAANGDFNLNDTEGGGALLRDVNFAMPGLASTLNYPFRPWVKDDFGSGGGSAGYTGIIPGGGIRRLGL